MWRQALRSFVQAPTSDGEQRRLVRFLRRSQLVVPLFAATDIVNAVAVRSVLQTTRLLLGQKHLAGGRQPDDSSLRIAAPHQICRAFLRSPP